MRFNEGDKVKVEKIVDVETLPVDLYDIIGKTGIIVEADSYPDETYPYGVRFDEVIGGIDEEIFFKEEELELA